MRNARARRVDAEAAAAQQEGDAVLRHANALVTEQERSAMMAGPETPAIAATCEAEKSRFAGRSDPDLREAAATRWDELGHPYPAAYARWRQAEADLTASGERARGRARQTLRHAHDVASQLGAQPLRLELESLARRARIDLQEPPTPGQDVTPEPSPAQSTNSG